MTIMEVVQEERHTIVTSIYAGVLFNAIYIYIYI